MTTVCSHLPEVMRGLDLSDRKAACPDDIWRWTGYHCKTTGQSSGTYRQRKDSKMESCQ